MRVWMTALIGLCLPGLAAGQPAPRPTVGELFTSEGCSSCPPADALVTRLAQTRGDLLLLSFHVTYWNGLGWRDPFSLDAATERQRRYVALGASPEVYTPALVVDGRLDAVGSDSAAVERSFRMAAAERDAGPSVEIQRQPAGLTVSVGPGPGSGSVLLIGYDRMHRTAVGRGENGGRTLDESNIVRSVTVLGRWTGAPVVLRAPLPAGQDTAVLVQRDDGHILGAAVSRTGGADAP